MKIFWYVSDTYEYLMMEMTIAAWYWVIHIEVKPKDSNLFWLPTMHIVNSDLKIWHTLHMIQKASKTE